MIDTLSLLIVVSVQQQCIAVSPDLLMFISLLAMCEDSVSVDLYVIQTSSARHAPPPRRRPQEPCLPFTLRCRSRIRGRGDSTFQIVGYTRYNFCGYEVYHELYRDTSRSQLFPSGFWTIVQAAFTAHFVFGCRHMCALFYLSGHGCPKWIFLQRA